MPEESYSGDPLRPTNSRHQSPRADAEAQSRVAGQLQSQHVGQPALPLSPLSRLEPPSFCVSLLLS